MLNEALRLIRVYHDLRQVDVAEQLGISKSYLSEIEKGSKKPTLDLMEKYSKNFQIPVSSIMFFSENIDNTKAYEKARRCCCRQDHQADAISRGTRRAAPCRLVRTGTRSISRPSTSFARSGSWRILLRISQAELS